MDDRRFDAFVRQLASGQSRRSVLKGLLGLGGVALAGGALTESADAARRPTPTPKPVKCPQRQHWDGTKCTCDSGATCGSDCCSGGAVCCDNACCNGQCYGEELCCPAGRVVCDGTCCAPGEQCFDGVCRTCAPCGDQCCGGQTPICCQSDSGSTCVADAGACCTGDADCASGNRCEGSVLINSLCRSGVCQDFPHDCTDEDDVCVTYVCDAQTLVCFGTLIPGCCLSSENCVAVDLCTPAQCLDTNTCNTVSNCTSEEHCCSGTCASLLDDCCTTPEDCPPAFCSDLGDTAYSYACIDHVCVRQDEDCIGDDDCTSYGCDEVEGVCYANSRCTSDQFCCEDGSCSVGGLCGCTIDGEYFPPYVPGCPTGVAPNFGTICGCAENTGAPCQSTDECQDMMGEGICAGVPGSSTCVIPASPIG